MAMPHFADPVNSVVEEEPVIPDHLPLTVIADDVVRGKRQLSKDQMRLLIELLPYHLPKLSAVAHVRYDYAKELDEAIAKAVERSNRPPLLNGPVEQLPAEELKKPMASFRRW